MKRLLTILLGVGVLCVSMPLSATAGMKAYAAIRGGLAIPEFEPDGGDTTKGKDGALVGASLGIQPLDFLRWDVIDFSYFNAWQSKSVAGIPAGFGYSNMTLGTGFRAGYFADDWKWHPYVSLGLAGNRSIYERDGERKSRWYFQWSVGGGIEYDIMDRMGIGIRYQFSQSDFDRFNLTERAHRISAEVIVMVFE
ncbi:MAG: outer membrane beta-barrel protein [Myxococcota bacterium]|nr:outer membrane beta-barrel protein [Myxococcota bacterium]